MESNHRRAAFQTAALPTELLGQTVGYRPGIRIPILGFKARCPAIRRDGSENGASGRNRTSIPLGESVLQTDGLSQFAHNLHLKVERTA